MSAHLRSRPLARLIGFLRRKPTAFEFILPFAAAAAFLALSVLPVSSAFAQANHKPKVALVMKSLANEFFLTMETGAKDYQKHNPDKFDLITNGIKDETDTANQIRIAGRATQGVIVFSTAESERVAAIARASAPAGVELPHTVGLRIV